jgi:hypothetical protein
VDHYGGKYLVKSRFALTIFAITLIVLGAVHPADALALRTQQRPPWMVGIGWGIGSGIFNSPNGSQQEYKEGGIPLIRVGRMLGSKTMLAVNYSGWMLEFDEERLKTGDAARFYDEAEDSTIIKDRRSQQQFVLSLYWFPGNPEGASGGVYIRAGAGLGWASANKVPITPGEEQGDGDRIDEWGWGVSAETGYEFWVHKHATLGAGVFYDYMSIQETIVDDSWFTGVSMNFNIYF